MVLFFSHVALKPLTYYYLTIGQEQPCITIIAVKIEIRYVDTYLTVLKSGSSELQYSDARNDLLSFHYNAIYHLVPFTVFLVIA